MSPDLSQRGSGPAGALVNDNQLLVERLLQYPVPVLRVDRENWTSRLKTESGTVRTPVRSVSELIL